MQNLHVFSVPFFLIFISCFSFFFHDLVMAENNNTSGTDSITEVKVGVVLDMKNPIGKMGLSCIEMALSDFYASRDYYKTRLILHTRDSKDDAVGAAAAALDLLKNVQVEAIIGPLSSMQAEFVIDLGNKTQVPIISFSATSAFFSPLQNPYFIRAAHDDTAQVKAISAIVQAFGWREVVPIYEANEFREGIMTILADAFQSIGTRIPYRSVIHRTVTHDQILAELYKLKTMQTRVFIAHMNPTLASLLFTKAKEVGMMEEGYVWLTTNAVTSSLSSMKPIMESMEGVLGVRPHIPRTKQLENFRVRWKTKYLQKNPTELNANLEVFGIWAYDAATALAMAVEKVGASKGPFEKPENLTNSKTDIEIIGVSQNGPSLLQALLSRRFTGLTGQFNISGGQLQSSAYQIVNIFGSEVIVVGFWTPENGIVRKMNASESSYSTSKANFRSITWPGDITSPPKGWQIPVEGKKLKIGVPVKTGFTEFVKIIQDHETNKTTFKGYCIDVFDAVMRNLSYNVPYEYVAYATPDGKSKGTYNDLVNEVFLGELDAVVGDITIIANRSLYVDFTLPFTESGVSMVVRMKDDNSKNAWTFLKPLSWELWITSFWSFVFIGFVVWVLEHRINEDFRGPPSHQAGTVLWFSFSSMVFAHREKVLSNLARFVMIIWCFVVLVLTQSYTASLTSMLTVQRLQPSFTNMEELRSRGENVGYQRDTFVVDILKQMNFHLSNLKPYNSLEELDKLFSNDTKEGSIGAAFDEIPYMKLFVNKYRSKYTMLAPTKKTAGFGFAFPIGSPLVHDVSRAVLNVTEGDYMIEIEKTWLGEPTCPNSSASVPSDSSSNSLDLDSFWGLFLIAVIASFSALALHTIMFLQEHWPMLRSSAPKTSIWTKIIALSKHFDKKDLSSHTFKKSKVPDKDGVDITADAGSVQASPNANDRRSPSVFSLQTAPNTNCPPSPSRSSYSRDGNFIGSEAGLIHDWQTEQETVVDIELVTPNQLTPKMHDESKNQAAEVVMGTSSHS